MKVIKAKWFNNADSPVVLMIDDLNNLWFDLNKNGYSDIGEDWGYLRELPHSSFSFLRKNLLNKFPEIKITFFTVVGNPIICKHEDGKIYSGKINENSASLKFFKTIHNSNNFEIAYHGFTHGAIKDGKYFHEWLTFNSVKEALKNIEKGQKICKEVFGKQLKGGKYPGYASNIYSDESIDKAGFFWWCRKFTYNDFLEAGNDYSVFEIKTFGEKKIVDFPSTVSPSILPKNPIEKAIKFILRNPYLSLKAYLENLLGNKQVISIQEHAGAIKANGRRQFPNIIDDMSVLQYIFSFLRRKNVWYATCSEIVNYYIAFNSTRVENTTENNFKLRYSGRVKNPWITLLIDKECPVKVISPSGRSYKGIKILHKNKHNLVNIKVENGYYQIK